VIVDCVMVLRRLTRLLKLLPGVTIGPFHDIFSIPLKYDERSMQLRNETLDVVWPGAGEHAFTALVSCDSDRQPPLYASSSTHDLRSCSSVVGELAE
jgi:hypothetical protein